MYVQENSRTSYGSFKQGVHPLFRSLCEISCHQITIRIQECVHRNIQEP